MEVLLDIYVSHLRLYDVFKFETYMTGFLDFEYPNFYPKHRHRSCSDWLKDIKDMDYVRSLIAIAKECS